MAFNDSIIEEEVKKALEALNSMCKRLGLEKDLEQVEVTEKESKANEACQTDVT